MAGRHGEAAERWECVEEADGKQTEHDRTWQGKTFKGPTLEMYISQLGSPAKGLATFKNSATWGTSVQIKPTGNTSEPNHSTSQS